MQRLAVPVQVDPTMVKLRQELDAAQDLSTRLDLG